MCTKVSPAPLSKNTKKKICVRPRTLSPDGMDSDAESVKKVFKLYFHTTNAFFADRRAGIESYMQKTARKSGFQLKWIVAESKVKQYLPPFVLRRRHPSHYSSQLW